jgi:hypothetical protein
MRYTFLTNFRMTCEIDGQIHSELMSDSYAFDIDSDGNLSCELEDLQLLTDTTALIFIEGYGCPMKIDIDKSDVLEEYLFDEITTIEDLIIENY